MSHPLLGEGCGDPTGITGVEQAHGILNIHEDCDPPCARFNAATLFLARRHAEATAEPPSN